METSLLKDLIEQTAEATALRVAQEMRVDISKSFERIGKLELTVGIGEGKGNGLKDELRIFKNDCVARKNDCTTVHEAIRTLALQGTSKVKTWHLLATGAVAGASTAGTVILALKTILAK